MTTILNSSSSLLAARQQQHAFPSRLGEPSASPTAMRRRPSGSSNVPSKLDLHYITSNLLAASEPMTSHVATYEDVGRETYGSSAVVDMGDNQSLDDSLASKRSQTSRKQQRSSRQSGGNSPSTLATFLEQRHSQRYLCFSLSDNRPDDRTLMLLHRQIVKLDWISPGKPSSQTPTISTMLQVCYALSAWLGLHDDNIALVYCSNGKTRSAIAIACFLKFSGKVHKTRDGFCHFLEKRCPESLPAEQVLQELPASLHTFFRNFDECIELGSFLNPKPLMLRAIALQGVPVEDKPCLDLWDAQGRHIYSSHAHLWDGNLQPTNSVAAAKAKDEDEFFASVNSSQWAEEEGFYRVNQVVEGDFCLLCRFGGPHARDSHDTSKIIFRYANTTGFLGAGGTYELPTSRVDLARRYAHSFDEEDFLVSLVFESHWNCRVPEEASLLKNPCSEQVLPPILRGYEAMEEGWHVIFQHHAAQPITNDVERFLGDADMRDCPRHLVTLSLQLANFDWKATKTNLMAGSLSTWWTPGQQQQDEGDYEYKQDAFDPEALEATMTRKREVRQKVLDILAESKVLSDLDKMDFGLQRRDAGVGDEKMDYEEVDNNDDNPQQPPVSLLYKPSLVTPHARDIVNAFGTTNGPPDFLQARDENLTLGSVPRFPVIPNNADYRLSNPLAIDDPANRAALEMFMAMDHPSITLNDLIQLQRDSQTWYEGGGNDKKQQGAAAALQQAPESPSGAAATTKGRYVNEAMKSIQARQTVSSHAGRAVTSARVADVNAAIASSSLATHATLEGMGQVKSNQDLKKVAAHLSSVPFDEPLASAAAPAPARAGAAAATVSAAGGVPAARAPDPAGAVAASAAADVAGAGPAVSVQGAAKTSQTGMAASKQSTGGMIGSAMAALQASLTARLSQKDTTNEAVVAAAGQATAAAVSPGPPVDQHEKYASMSRMGVPHEAIRNAMKRDGVDPAGVDLVKLTAAAAPEVEDTGIPLKEDDIYGKYFKMRERGVPTQSVKQALQRDGYGAFIIELDPEKSLEAQAKAVEELKAAAGPPVLKDDPTYAKYFKMRRMGLPVDAIKQALQRDGLEPGIADLDPQQTLESQKERLEDLKKQQEEGGTALKDDPKYSKYFKMVKMGLPTAAVKNALQRDGLDPNVVDMDPDKSLESQMKAGDKDSGPPLKEDPKYAKYFKMLKMGLPKDAVKNSLQRDGEDPTILDLDPEKSLASQRGTSSDSKQDTGIPLKDDPEYSKYFKMLKMGLPLEAVKNSLQRDGKDPSVMDLDPEKSLAFQRQAPASGGSRLSSQKKKKSRVRRKKIYWTPVDQKKVKEDSLWSLVKGKIKMGELKYDQTEFNNLFTESTDPAERNKKKGTAAKKPAKKAVQVIDGKRSMNGGIILKRLRRDYKEIAECVEEMDEQGMDATQLMALKDFLPTNDERKGLLKYMELSKKSEETEKTAFADLSECEKYMLTMIDVDDATAKFNCMIFKVQFRPRLEELIKSIKVVEKACDEVRSSEKLREILAIILTLVNEINTGGDGQEAMGFSVTALLKLNEAKAFDRKTTALQYLVKLVQSNDKSLLSWPKDLVHISEAETIILDSILNEMSNLSREVKNTGKTVTQQADELEKAGKCQPVSVEELREQKTSVRTLEISLGRRIQQFNQVDHHTGRTKMERFFLNAEQELDSTMKFGEIVREKYSGLLEYLCEDENFASNEFFGTMRKFMREFGNAIQQVEKQELQKAKEKKRSEAEASKTGAKGSPAAPAVRPLAARGKTAPSKSDLSKIASQAAAKVKDKSSSTLPIPKLRSVTRNNSGSLSKQPAAVSSPSSSPAKAPVDPPAVTTAVSAESESSKGLSTASNHTMSSIDTEHTETSRRFI